MHIKLATDASSPGCDPPSFSAGVGRWCWPQFYQREDLHPGRRTLPGPEGAARPQRQGVGALLCWGSVRPQRSGKTRWKNRHLESGVEVLKFGWLVPKLMLSLGGGVSGKRSVFDSPSQWYDAVCLHEMTPTKQLLLLCRNTQSTYVFLREYEGQLMTAGYV